MGLPNSYRKNSFSLGEGNFSSATGAKIQYSYSSFSPRDCLFGELKHLDDRQQCRKAQKRNLSSQNGW